MKKVIIILLIITGIHLYFSWKPSASGIAEKMKVGAVITYQDKEYKSDWSLNFEEIKGYLRQKDRHYEKSMPIVTYDLIITSGEYNGPEIVKISNEGNGNYYWSAKKQPKGTLTVYHTVPYSVKAQNKLDQIDVGSNITLVGRISKNSEIESGPDNYAKLMHNNHKFILVKDVFE
ncbi:MAG: hypothetical protein ABIH08_00300 [Candidatus Omnitrophota bacterium]